LAVRDLPFPPHLNAGQRAILVALAYPEPTPGKRNDLLKISTGADAIDKGPNFRPWSARRPARCDVENHSTLRPLSGNLHPSEVSNGGNQSAKFSLANILNRRRAADPAPSDALHRTRPARHGCAGRSPSTGRSSSPFKVAFGRRLTIRRSTFHHRPSARWAGKATDWHDRARRSVSKPCFCEHTKLTEDYHGQASDW
jgi:hypothetical protein